MLLEEDMATQVCICSEIRMYYTPCLLQTSHRIRRIHHVFVQLLLTKTWVHTHKGDAWHNTKPQLSLLQVPLKTSSKSQHFSCYRFSALLIHEVAFAEVTDVSTELPSAQLSFLKTATVTFFLRRFYSLDTKLKFLETGHLETCTCQLARCVGIGFCGLTMRTAASRQAALLFTPRGSSGKVIQLYFSS